MSGALVAGLIMLVVLAAVFAVASYPGGPEGPMGRLGRGGLVAVLLALGTAIVGVSIVLLPEALVVGMALLVAGLLLVAIATLAALRGRPPDRPRRHAPCSDARASRSDAHDERGR